MIVFEGLSLVNGELGYNGFLIPEGLRALALAFLDARENEERAAIAMIWERSGQIERDSKPMEDTIGQIMLFRAMLKSI